MKAVKLSLLLAVFLLSSLVIAAPSHIVMLKTAYQTRPAVGAPSNLTRLAKYKYVRQVLTSRLENELKPFIKRLAANPAQVAYLPLISAVAVDLTPEKFNALRSDPQVYNIIPNGRLSFDYPSRPVQVFPSRTAQTNLNDGLLLHKVSELLAAGIDINKPGKIVGVIDTGVDGQHPDLASKVIRFKNFENGSTTPTDSDTHGTHVSGIIAGGKSSGTQLGVYPGAKLVVASALTSHSNMVLALQWMLDPDGNPQTEDQPYVINNSWHSGSAAAEPFYLAMQALKDADILICFSAGNAGRSGITRPKEFPITFTTAAVDKKGVIGSFSSWGPANFNGQVLQKPEVASMGVDVVSTLPGGKYGKMSGTSMASPFTAGSVALLGAYFPELSPYTIADAIHKTTQRQIQAPWDRQYGNGLVNVHQAYLALKQATGR